MRVLLIEDQPGKASLIELTLAAEGIVCDLVVIGKEGLKINKIDKYDLVILDLTLSDIDGFEVLLRLRAAKVKVPIFIISSLINNVD